MNKEEIFNQLVDTTIDVIGLDKSEVKMKSHFLNDLDCDSMMMAELMMLVQNKFDINIPDAEAESMETIGEVVDYIYEKKYAS